MPEPHDDRRPRVGDDPDAGVDWFGHPLHADGGHLTAPVPCPFCGTTFRRSRPLAAHLDEVHAVARGGGRFRRQSVRFERWVQGLRFLPLWFVLPLNAALTTVLYLAWGEDLTMFSLESQLPVIKTWIVRLSLLPSVVLLSWRVVDRRV
jgi:hypothetical protein